MESHYVIEARGPYLREPNSLPDIAVLKGVDDDEMRTLPGFERYVST
jgi:hypothetical protein